MRKLGSVDQSVQAFRAVWDKATRDNRLTITRNLPGLKSEFEKVNEEFKRGLDSFQDPALRAEFAQQVISLVAAVPRAPMSGGLTSVMGFQDGGELVPANQSYAVQTLIDTAQAAVRSSTVGDWLNQVSDGVKRDEEKWGNGGD